MDYLNTKLRRDIRRNWTQFFSVFLMATLSILMFVGVQGAWHGLEVSLDNYNRSSHLADSWIYSTGFSDEDIRKINNVDGVEQVAEKTRITIDAVDDSSHEKHVSLDTFNNSITTPTLLSGENMSAHDSGGVWLNKEYAEKNHIDVGQTLSVKYNNHEIPLTVRGTVQSADRVYFTGSQEFIAPNYENYGYGFISEGTLKGKIKYKGSPNVVELKNSTETIRVESEAILGARHIAFYDQETLREVSDALDRVGQIRTLSFLFSSIFLLLAVLAMYSTIRRLIETQTKEIAILKALGFSNRSIALHYASFGLLVGGGGTLVGMLISPMMSLFVLETQKSMFSVPEWTISYSYSSLAVIALVLLVSVMSAFLASRGALSELPALYLRGGIKKKVKPVLLERISPLWNALKLERRWVLRDAFLNRARMLMGIFGVAAGMMLLTAGFGLPESINHLVDKAYTEDFSYTKRLDTNSYETVKNKYDGQWVQITPARYSPDDQHNRLLIVVSDGDYVNMKTEDGSKIADDGIYVTKGFASRAHYKKGDEIKVHPALDDREYSFTIKGIIVSETNQGAYIMEHAWENAGGKFSPYTLLTGEDPPRSEVDADPEIQDVIEIADQKQNAYDFVGSLMSIFLMLTGFAILLVVVVLYNLGSLNFVERMRAYATLRVLGFHKNELRNITMSENIAITEAGWLLGLPLGTWFLDTYVRTFSTLQLEYTSYISFWNLALVSAVVWACSLTTTFFIGRRIRKINMVEALKAVE